MTQPWSRSQATIIKSLCNRGIENTTIAKKAALGRREDFDADLIFFGLMKDEAEAALRGTVGGSKAYVLGRRISNA